MQGASSYNSADYEYQYQQQAQIAMQQYQNSASLNIINQPVKTIIGTEECRDIVQLFNQKPFNQNLTLLSFDELTSSQLLDLLNQILTHLDKEQFEKIREKPQEHIIQTVSSTLRILNYPIPPPPQENTWQNGLINSERRVMYPVIYYLLTRLPELEKRAYLAKFLVPFIIPEDIPIDEELQKMLNDYKEFQAVFQVHHQQFEGAEKESMNPNELKKEITQLEQEREQLISRINMFKGKKTNTPEFQALLEVTNMLRKEQEEEARIQDKLRQQRAHLEWTDQQLLTGQQRLLDAQKSLSPNNTPEQMLQALRNEVKKNRELCNERLAIEINEKRKKLEQTEKLLSDPPITQNELIQMENNVVNLRRNVNLMEDKLAKQNPSDDKLTIYKSQAALVTKKKEKSIEELKRAEEDMTGLEKQVKDKEGQLEKEMGPGFKNQDELKNYANQLRDKNKKFKQMKDEIKDIQNELSMLSRTHDILKEKKNQYEQLLKNQETHFGVTGVTEAQRNLEQISSQAQAINEQKGKTLEEISKFVLEIEKKLKDKKSSLQPIVTELNTSRQKLKDLDIIYKEKKQAYDSVMLGSESEIQTLESEYKRLKDDVYKEDSKISILKYNTQILDLKISRLNDESEFHKKTKKLSNENPTYVALFEQKQAQLQQQISELKKEREWVKEKHEPSLRQQQMFSDIKKLLQLKLQVAKLSSTGQNFKGSNQGGNVNRLVIE